jgi:hypothetical protein
MRVVGEIRPDPAAPRDDAGRPGRRWRQVASSCRRVAVAKNALPLFRAIA